ncbi:MAG: class II aldolase/adducin family protein, partial [Streptosporangiaceae bacterium]
MNSSVTAALRDEVLRANQAIPRARLATLTWGNVSGIYRDAGVYVIKPSGVSYDDLTAEQLVVVDLEDGRVVDGHLRPSVDSETHRRLYLAFGGVGGITHTHSPSAVAFAQAKRDIPVLGTTHADAFNGPIRCTRSTCGYTTTSAGARTRPCTGCGRSGTVPCPGGQHELLGSSRAPRRGAPRQPGDPARTASHPDVGQRQRHRPRCRRLCHQALGRV